MKYLYAFIVFAHSFNAFSQPVINEIGPDIGDSFTINFDDQEFVPGDSGTDQTYNFSDFVNQQSITQSVVDAQSTEQGPILFQESTAAFYRELEGLGDFYSYYDFSGNVWTEYGAHGGNIGVSTTTHYTDPFVRLEAPVNYGDSGSDTYSGETTTFVQTVELSGSAEYSVDGYGTLILPSNTFENCLRVVSIGEESQDFGDGLTGENNFTHYLYYVDGFPLPLVHYSIIESSILGQPQQTIYQTSLLTAYNGVPLSTEDVSYRQLQIFPNPATSQIRLSLSEPYSEVRMYDSLGKLVFSGLYNKSDEIDVSQFPSGLYVVLAESGLNTVCRQKLVIK